MQQSSDKPRKHHITPEQGTGYYPISDIQFDVMNLIVEKSKALQAYDHYLRDCQPNQELVGVIEQMKADDRRHVEELKRFLGA